MQSVDRPSTECRPITERYIGQVDRVLTEYRPPVDRASTDYRPSVDRLSTECRPLYRPLYRPISRSTLPTVNKIRLPLTLWNTQLTRLSSCFGVKGNALAWFRSYVTSRKQCICVESNKSYFIWFTPIRLQRSLSAMIFSALKYISRVRPTRKLIYRPWLFKRWIALSTG